MGEVNICGGCATWRRYEEGEDSGICSNHDMRFDFYQSGCAEFKLKETDPNGLSGDELGAKMDAGKLPARLIADFAPALLKIGKVLEYGASKKYTAHGWLEVENPEERYLDAFWRHLLAGKGNDPDSGIPHLHHACWNLLAVLTLEKG